MRGQLVDDDRQNSREACEQLLFAETGVLRQGLDDLLSEGAAELAGSDLRIRTGADPRIDRVAETSLLKLADETAEGPSKVPCVGRLRSSLTGGRCSSSAAMAPPRKPVAPVIQMVSAAVMALRSGNPGAGGASACSLRLTETSPGSSLATSLGKCDGADWVRA